MGKKRRKRAVDAGDQGQGHTISDKQERLPDTKPLSNNDEEPAKSSKSIYLHPVGVIVFLGVLCGFAFSNNLGGEFLFDDKYIIANNSYIRSVTNIPKLFTLNWWDMAPGNTRGQLYRPITATTYAVDIFAMRLSGREPDNSPSSLDVRFLHFSSNFYHFITSIVFFFLLLRMYNSGRFRYVLSCLGASIFAVHPVHVEPVTNLVGRAEILACLFYVSALLTWTYIGKKRKRTIVSCATATLWFLGLLCKEMAVTLPIILILWDLITKRHRSLNDWIRSYLPFLIVSILYAIIRRSVLGAAAISPYEALPAAEVSYIRRLMTMCHAFAYYLQLMIWPSQFCADYSGFPVAKSVLSVPFLVSFLIHSLLICGAFFALRLPCPQSESNAGGIRHNQFLSDVVSCIQSRD